MGRKLTTGRFDTRAELEEFVWNRWRNTNMGVGWISDCAGVSEPTVNKILSLTKPPAAVCKAKPYYGAIARRGRYARS